jgi:cell division protein FtsZ
MPFELEMNETEKIFTKKSIYRIKVIGVGGAGNNAVQRMTKKGVHDVELIAANTDVQVLERNDAPIKIQLGKTLTRGLGAGGDPKIGRESAIESVEEVKDLIKGSDLLFIVAGFGGGTGTGAAPIIAKISKELGILTVAIVTTPFHFEGAGRQKIALEGLVNLKENVDSLIKIANDKLLEDENVTVDEGFEKADDVLYQAITGISDLITKPGLVNVDFADVAAVLRVKGSAMLGIGIAKGKNRAEEAVKMALNSRFLEDQIKNATATLVNISGKNPTLLDIKVVNEFLSQKSIDSEKSKMGVSCIDVPDDMLKVTVVASGYDNIPEEDSNDVYEIPAVYRMFSKSIVTEEITRLNSYLNEHREENEEKE